MTAGGNFGQGLRSSAKVFIRIGQVAALANQANGKAPHAPSLADAGIQDGTLAAGIAANEKKRIGLIDTGNTGIEQVGCPSRSGVQRAAILAAIEIDHAEAGEQILKRINLLDRGEIARDAADA